MRSQQCSCEGQNLSLFIRKQTNPDWRTLLETNGLSSSKVSKSESGEDQGLFENKGDEQTGNEM